MKKQSKMMQKALYFAGCFGSAAAPKAARLADENTDGTVLR